MKLRHSVACCMLALGTLSAAHAIAQPASNQGYYRAPALHDQTLVFTAEGDLWTQTLGQKAATRLARILFARISWWISSNVNLGDGGDGGTQFGGTGLISSSLSV